MHFRFAWYSLHLVNASLRIVAFACMPEINQFIIPVKDFAFLLFFGGVMSISVPGVIFNALDVFWFYRASL